MTQEQLLSTPLMLSATVRGQIDAWLKKYPAEQKQSAVIQALTYVQNENGGWLSTSLIDAVAVYLDMPKIAVYEVATFYNLFDLKPVGRHKIAVCASVSCMLCGSDETLNYLQKKLKVGLGETTPDGKFTLKKVECLASCGTAPMMQIGQQYYENLSPEKIDNILASLE